jgi:hypothetical protein
MLMPNSADVTGATDKRSDPPRVTTVPSQFDAESLSETQGHYALARLEFERV